MKDTKKFYIIDGSALPEVFLKVLDVNEHLKSGKSKSISEATEKSGISRSAYYKYKDKIRPFNQFAIDSIITFDCVLTDKSGILSNILSVFAKCGANILTINQNIPSDGQAVVIISARTENMKTSIEALIKRAIDIDGVIKFDIISSR